MRTVLKSHNEVAHVWANQGQSEGRSGNIFFEGDTIYSYGHHFPMARLIPEKNVVLFTNAKSSVSTEKHKGIVRSAIDTGHYRVIECLNPTPGTFYGGEKSYNHEGNVKDMVETTKDLRSKFDRARERCYYYYNEQRNWLTNLWEYCRLFDIEIPVNDYTGYVIGETEAIDKYNKYSYEKEQRELKTEREKQQLFEQIKYAVNDLKRQWIKGETDQKQIVAGWDKHRQPQFHEKLISKGKQYFGFGGTLLRKKGNQVETSRGAYVPIDQAKHLYLRWKLGGIVANEKVGYYKVDHKEDGGIKIGCHFISNQEIERFGKSQEWDKDAEKINNEVENIFEK